MKYILFMSTERVRGIEPLASAWKAEVLPLYDTRSEDTNCDYLTFGCQRYFFKSTRYSSPLVSTFTPSDSSNCF